MGYCLKGHQDTCKTALGICEGTWIQELLKELGINHSSFKIFCDGQATTNIANKHHRTKHIAIDHHFIYEKINDIPMERNYVPCLHQIADILTIAS